MTGSGRVGSEMARVLPFCANGILWGRHVPNVLPNFRTLSWQNSKKTLQWLTR